MENQQPNYITSAKRQFLYYKTLGEKAIAQLNEEQLFERQDEDSNSIAMIVNHLCGNMLSRWTDFLTSDGEKDWRDRDSEFEDVLKTKKEVSDAWEKGWKCLFEALENLAESDLAQIIYIRNEGHTVMEAINRQMAHYPYHIGQIVFCAKMLKSSAWESLSIPRNASRNYNDAKFSADKAMRHFTEEELKRIK
ncbi:DUF1572 family protein [Flavobacterium sp.]|uniref:DUF1572 family protein n=1 Tax=Flavobacterium sp. TaxID=239 RepID=UPI001225294F|nr:DUF1572 family protein [Flavobacterium sp.]RZJ72262.1 MAG: DUF1572 domain-containing protein [Flavobacterium sp.]